MKCEAEHRVRRHSDYACDTKVCVWCVPPACLFPKLPAQIQGAAGDLGTHVVFLALKSKRPILNRSFIFHPQLLRAEAGLAER